jgi:hypothetical protein
LTHSATCIMKTNLESRTRIIPNGCSKSCSGVPEFLFRARKWFFPFLAVSWSFWHIAVSIQYRKHSKFCTLVTDSISHQPYCLGIKTLSLKCNKSKASLVPIINFQITCILGSCCLLKKSLILVAYALVIRESSQFLSYHPLIKTRNYGLISGLYSLPNALVFKIFIINEFFYCRVSSY